jgi:hypothetical protein
VAPSPAPLPPPRRPRARDRAARGLALLALLGLACREEPAAVTGVRVVASFASIDVDQLSFTLIGTAGPLNAPAVRPEARAAALASPQSFVYYVADDRAVTDDRPEAFFTCRVKGLKAGRPVARGGSTVKLRRHEIVECPALLAPLVEGDDGTDGEGCADGGREAFLAGAAFPRLAACGAERGAQLHYAQARAQARSICAAGWHLCSPGALIGIPDTAIPTWVPLATGQGTCAWLDKETTGCGTMDLYGGNTSCFFLRIAIGSLEGTGPCNLPELGKAASCADAWRLAVLFGPDQWTKVSVKDGNACYPHVGVTCGGAPDGPKGNTPPATCWVGCCKD